MAEVAVPRKLFGEILRLSTVLDDFSRYIIAWKLCTTMRSEDVTATLELALKASGCDRAQVALRLRLLSDNGPSYIAGDLAKWLKGQGSGLIRLSSTITLGGCRPTGPYGRRRVRLVEVCDVFSQDSI